MGSFTCHYKSFFLSQSDQLSVTYIILKKYILHLSEWIFCIHVDVDESLNDRKTIWFLAKKNKTFSHISGIESHTKTHQTKSLVQQFDSCLMTKKTHTSSRFFSPDWQRRNLCGQFQAITDFLRISLNHAFFLSPPLRLTVLFTVSDITHFSVNSEYEACLYK